MTEPAPGSSNEHVIVTDDWTRNWHAKIAIKITAMFMWLIILSTFGGLVYFTKDLEEDFAEQVADDLDGLGYRLNGILLANPGQVSAPAVIQALKHEVERELQHRTLAAVTLEYEQTRLQFGAIDADAEYDVGTRSFAYLPANPDVADAPSLTVQARYLKPASYAARTREHFIIAVVLAVLMLGLLLRWTIHNVLAKPFQVLVDATRSVSDGNLDLRLDGTREDEFGHLSRFFNQMLDRIQAQQRELTRANEELTCEVQVRKQAEAKLLEHRDELERQVEQRTHDLELARDQALRASQTKSAFIANISHEIRTPLTPIIGFAEAMMSDTQSKDECRRSLESIIRNGRHLLNIINDILDLSKIEADRLEVERIPVVLLQVLSDVESAVGVLAREKGLEFAIRYDFPIPGTVHTDPTRLKQILMNLAMNAVKFTERGFVAIEVSYGRASSKLQLDVIDSGIGISQENLDRMFKAFSQADSSITRQFGGTGLGLYISRRLARLLGGDIVLQSAQGVGSRFVVTIEAGDVSKSVLLQALPSEIAVDGPVQPEDLKVHGRVLLAEDSPDNQQLISYYLRRVGAEVDLADNGEIACEMAMASDYDLVLMDMQMPVMGGLDAVRLLRAAGYGGVIVALTANAMKEDRDRYEEVGCDGFLSKPIELGRFYGVVAQYLRLADAGKGVATVMSAELEALIDQFRAAMPGYAEQLRAARAGQNVVAAKMLVHNLKGMGGSFGFPVITEAAAVADVAFRQGDVESGFDKLGRLIDFLHEFSVPVRNRRNRDAAC